MFELKIKSENIDFLVELESYLLEQPDFAEWLDYKGFEQHTFQKELLTLKTKIEEI